MLEVCPSEKMDEMRGDSDSKGGPAAGGFEIEEKK